MATYNITLTLTADTYVDSANPTTNYGAATTLLSGFKTASLKSAIFEIGVPSLAAYKNKKFKNLIGTFNVTAISDAGYSVCYISAFGTNTTLVTESTLTYNSNNIYQGLAARGANSLINAAGSIQLTIADVTTLMNAIANGDYSRLFVVYGLDGSGQGDVLFSISADESANDATFTLVCEDCPPSKPVALGPSGTFEDGSNIVRVSWKYLHDVSPVQYKFDLLWSDDDGATWNTITQTTANQYCDFPASTFTDGLILWKVKTYNEYNEASVFSDTMFFYSIAAPGSPAVSAVNTNTARPTIKLVHGSEQHVFEVEIYQGSTIVYASGEIPSMTDREITPDIYLNDGPYTVKARIKNKYSLWSLYGENTFTIVTTKPAKPTIAIISDSRSIIVDGGSVDANKFEIFRSISGENTFVKIAEVETLPVSDVSAASGIAYDYFIRSLSATNTFNDSDVVSKTLSFKSTFIALAENPAIYAELKHNIGRKPSRSEVYMPSVIQNYFVGRVKPVADLPEHESRAISIEHYVKTMPDLIAVLAVLRSRKTLFYRDARGRAFHCVLTGLEASEVATGYLIKAQLLEVDFDFGVNVYYAGAGTYHCTTNDPIETWPTNYAAGSIMIVIDETAHAVSAYYYFDGTTWNKV